MKRDCFNKVYDQFHFILSQIFLSCPRCCKDSPKVILNFLLNFFTYIYQLQIHVNEFEADVTLLKVKVRGWRK